MKMINWPAIGLTVLIAIAMAYVFEALKLPRTLSFVIAFYLVFYMSDTLLKRMI
ncbi:hypothetical protein J4H70_16525 [Vibrio alginolyticus]|uniref:hypothetical protein n=1 Tax=Vibrio alginolyticus TaxID=663 RepID=UPI001BD682BE|nr:hypothetical protein [Vibrio alginolyticus]MBS9810382.1 hypothetical protein [Vibrio alginolyticus]